MANQNQKKIIDRMTTLPQVLLLQTFTELQESVQVASTDVDRSPSPMSVDHSPCERGAVFWLTAERKMRARRASGRF
jgi:hypothetical protein